MEFDDDLQTLVAKQRRELSAVLSAESDLDFAFKLQMREAMEASLSLQPSSAAASSSKFHLEIFDDGEFNYVMAHLLAEEIDKFELGRSDREKVEAEMRWEREDLDRWIHDRSFARDVVSIPEVEWQKTGDLFHKPYEGFLGVSISGEGFRLYCKGLVREEMVGSVRKRLAGIGVAICDSSGEVVIFEMKKPLVLREISAQIAEVTALIEGLNAAVTLGLKRINIFCDDSSLYGIVTGKGVARQGSIATLVDELTLLQRRFTRCSSNIVHKKDIQYALELARNAIVLQTTWPGETSGVATIIETACRSKVVARQAS